MLFHLLLLLFLLSNCISSSPAPIINNKPDELALFAFKSSIDRDPLGLSGQWNRSLHYCRWPGVTCGGRRHPYRVRALDLGSMNLTGHIPRCLSNLTFLRRLNLDDNQFYGHIPWELGHHLSQLRHLNLSVNLLGGEIPATLSHCARLQILSLRNNNLQGRIPTGLANCSDLQTISLRNNKMLGDIPSELGTLQNLHHLILRTNKLTGRIPPSLENLSSLEYLDLSENSLSGGIPPSLGSLSSIEHLNLSYNSLSGGIPPSFGNLLSIEYLNLSYNSLSGGIPPSFGNLSSLEQLDLSVNSLSGGIPPSLGNLSSLEALDLSENSLSGGIPPSLGKLASLTLFSLSYNKLSGVIPLYIYNISGIHSLSMHDNKLHGTLPKDVGYTLPSLQYLYMSENRLHGSLPTSLANASHLQQIELDSNGFSGTIPRNLAGLQSLSFLNLHSNQLEAREANDWSFLSVIANSSLQVLEVSNNLLGGTLPNIVTNNSTSLTVLALGSNQISGTIPSWIWNLRNLEILVLEANHLSGSIHADIGNLQRLHDLFLDGNKLSREIPSTLGNLAQLNLLYMDRNYLTGSIPTSLVNCQQLELLNLSHNHLTGPIPKAVLGISSLSISLDLSHNFLTGALPSAVGGLKNLKEFRITNNKLSGEIPSTLGQCQSLELLYMDGNFFHGNIPQSLSGLKGIQYVDLSSNILSGPIPEFLEDLRALDYLNISFNNFEGRVPENGVFGNTSEISVLGNSKLCGGIPQLHLPPCSIQTSKHRTHLLKLTLLLVAAALCTLLLPLCIWLRKRSWKSLATAAPIKDHHLMKVSYHELLKATDGFSPANLIGTGSFASVYKGIMGDEQNMVAVKVLNLQQRGALKNFIAECEALRNIRHRNLVRIVTSCSSIDFSGNEFKALIFEYMSNGSLDMWLYPEENDQHELRNLSLIQRFNIAKDVATAMDYLHHHGHMPVVHCDLKPSNILLDDEMIARVGDFGLAKLLLETISSAQQEKTNSSTLKGSIGYMPPEYGVANRVSTQGDVYSYGILLLEMFTGKRPIDNIFKDGLCLRQYVSASFSEKLMDIIDPRLFNHEEIGDAGGNITRKEIYCIEYVLRIGLLCTENSPSDRINMGDVTNKLHSLELEFI